MTATAVSAGPRYKRVLVKLSGEALMGAGQYGIDTATVDRIAGDIKQAADAGSQICMVVGGGNIFRRRVLLRRIPVIRHVRRGIARSRHQLADQHLDLIREPVLLEARRQEAQFPDALGDIPGGNHLVGGVGAGKEAPGKKAQVPAALAVRSQHEDPRA